MPPTVALANLLRYLPQDRRHALASGTPLPERSEGAALFADISGFTPLTEALTTALGARRGAEALPQHLNRVYDALIGQVERFGGSVIGFAGDAMTCWFAQDRGERATACALAMQQALQVVGSLPLPSGETAILAMKVAVVSGPVRRFLVGDPTLHLMDVLAGSLLTRLSTAEHLAAKGEVVLDEATACALAEALDIEAWHTEAHDGTRYAVVRALHRTVPEPPWPTDPATPLPVETLRPWLLPTIYERLCAGQGEFLTELRPAVALFLRFDGLDYDHDPAAGAKLDHFIGWVQQILARYEGTLIQLSIGEKGNYLYAAFGTPIAHEDDDRRAVLAALELRTLPPTLHFLDPVQIGISRGTMRTGAYGGSTRRTYGSLGDEVNLAARLMQHAPSGQVIASARVQAATAPFFAWRPLPPITVKGKRAPIAIFALEGTVQPTIHLSEAPYTLPMIGRSSELALIESKMAMARSGQGQIVGISAEAGMGKSRLVAEVLRRAQSSGFVGYGGECQSYGTNTPYLVWQPIWRAFFGLDPAQPVERQLQQLAHSVAESAPTLLPRLPLLGPLLNLPLPDTDLTRAFDPQLRKSSREALLVDLLKSRARALHARGEALLLVLEDCHWLDASSHDLLEAIGRAIWQLPVLLLMAHRPPDMERLQAPRVVMLPYFTPVELTELTEQETAQLISNRLTHLNPSEECPLPPALLSQLAQRAQGNPFYLEELVNYLYDQGLDPYDPQVLGQLELPNSLHSLILSRMDRLTEPQRTTLKVASVIGRLFHFHWLLGYYPALGEAERVRADLDRLSRLDLTPLESEEPELTYLFKHIITREVAYESLPYATRAHLHEQMGTFLEALPDGENHRRLDLLAYHYSHSENLPKKRDYLRRAGEAAQAAYANEAAREYYTQLLSLLEGEEQIAVRLKLGAVLEITGLWEQAEREYRLALAAATERGNEVLQAEGELALGSFLRQRGDYAQALEWLEQARARFETLDDAIQLSKTLSQMGTAYSYQGEFARAKVVLEHSLALAREADDPGITATVLNLLGIREGMQENYAEARPFFEQSLALHRSTGNKRGIADCLNNLGSVAREQGEIAIAQTLQEEQLLLRQEIGDRGRIPDALVSLGRVVQEKGDYEKAERYYQEAYALSLEEGNKRMLGLTLYSLGQAAYLQGAYPKAQRFLEEAIVSLEAIGYKTTLIYALSAMGDTLLAQDDYQAAQAQYQESLRLARELQQSSLMPGGLVGLAHLSLVTEAGQRGAQHATRLLAAVHGIVEQSQNPLLSHLVTLQEQTIATARETLGEEAFARYWEEGLQMSLEEVL